MLKRAALAAIFLSTLGIGIAYAAAFLPGGAPPWATWLLVIGTGTVLSASMALGAVRNGWVGRVGWAFAFAWLVIVGGFGAVLLLPAADPLDPTLWLGLPPRAAIVMYGVGLLPFFVVPVAYALTFEEQTLSEPELDRVRREARALRAGARPAGEAGEREPGGIVVGVEAAG